MITGKPCAVGIETGLLFLFELTDESANFILFPHSDLSKSHPERLSLNPSDGRFVDHDRPIRVWNMETTFKFVSLSNSCFTFDFASAD